MLALSEMDQSSRSDGIIFYMFPTIVYACASEPVGEIALTLLKLVLIASGVGVVFVTPVLLLVMFFIRRYRTRGFWWMFQRSLLSSVILGSLLAIGLFTYLYLDNYVFVSRVIDSDNTRGV